MKNYFLTIFLTCLFFSLTACDPSLSVESIKSKAQKNGDNEVKIHYICDPQDIYTKKNEEFVLGTKKFHVNYKLDENNYFFEDTNWKGGGAYGEIISKDNCSSKLSATDQRKNQNGFYCENNYSKQQRQASGGTKRIDMNYSAWFNDTDLTLSLDFSSNIHPSGYEKFSCKIDKDKQNSVIKAQETNEKADLNISSKEVKIPSLKAISITEKADGLTIEGPFGYNFGTEISFKECLKEKRGRPWRYTTLFKENKSVSDIYLFGQGYDEIQNLLSENQKKWSALPRELRAKIRDEADYLSAFTVNSGGSLSEDHTWIKDEDLSQVIDSANKISKKYVGVYNSSLRHSIYCGKDTREQLIEHSNNIFNQKLSSFLEPFEKTFVHFILQYSNSNNISKLVGLRLSVEGDGDYLMDEKVLPALHKKYGKPTSVGYSETRWITEDGLLVRFDSDCSIFEIVDSGQKCVYYESMGHQLINLQEEIQIHSLVIDHLINTLNKDKSKLSTDDL